MLELRTREPGRLEILRRLRRSTAPSSLSCIVPALRDGEPGKGDHLLLVSGSSGGAQIVPPALSSGGRHGGSRGDRCPPLLHLPSVFARLRASAPRCDRRNPARPPS